MVKEIKKFIAGTSIAMVALLLLAVPAVNAETNTLVVTSSENQGWLFNADPSTATAYEFNRNQASIGNGSLYVPPIGPNSSDKFIGLLPMGTAVSDFSSASYDFMIAGNGDESDANQFYANVYTNLEGSSSYYDCRFDFVPSAGSTTVFTTASFSSSQTAVNVAEKISGACPSTLDGMPAGSTISAIALNVGDTSSNDEGLAGYLDNVVVSSASSATTYDFDTPLVRLSTKDECKNTGWMASEEPVFKNQGDCVSHFASKGKAKGNPISNLLHKLF